MPSLSKVKCRQSLPRLTPNGPLRLAALLTLTAAVSGCHRETPRATFPLKPIKIVVYTKPGGPIDLTARRFADVASKKTGATFAVENRSGAGGVVAMESVLQARADGYTLFACTKSNVSNIVSSGRERYIDNFDWVGLLMTDPECVITRRGDFTDWEALVQDAKRPGRVQNWAGPAKGGLDHVTAMQIWNRCDISAQWIPHGGGSKAIYSLLTGDVVAYVGNPSDAVGRPNLQVIIVSSPERLPSLPDTPTFADIGFPDLNRMNMWRGFALKKGCPVEAKQWYDKLFAAVARDPDWKTFWEKDGIQTSYLGEEKFSEVVRADQSEFRLHLGTLGMLPDKQTTERSGWIGNRPFRVLVAIVFAHLVATGVLFRLKRLNRYGHIVILTGLMSVCCLLYWETTGFEQQQGAGPATVPRLWMGLIVLLTLAAGITYRAPIDDETSQRIGRVTGLALLLLGYLTLTVFVGYYASTAVFLVSAMLLFGERRSYVLLGVSLAWLIFAYLTFSKLLQLSFPTGRWIQNL